MRTLDLTLGLAVYIKFGCKKRLYGSHPGFWIQPTVPEETTLPSRFLAKVNRFWVRICSRKTVVALLPVRAPHRLNLFKSTNLRTVKQTPRGGFNSNSCSKVTLIFFLTSAVKKLSTWVRNMYCFYDRFQNESKDFSEKFCLQQMMCKKNLN